MHRYTKIARLRPRIGNPFWERSLYISAPLRRVKGNESLVPAIAILRNKVLPSFSVGDATNVSLQELIRQVDLAGIIVRSRSQDVPLQIAQFSSLIIYKMKFSSNGGPSNAHTVAFPIAPIPANTADPTSIPSIATFLSLGWLARSSVERMTADD